MKTLVTHISPDIDALTAGWLIHRFMPGWKEAVMKFVPAGKTLNEAAPDANSDIIHIDTGFGQYDHHHSDDDTCAARLVLDYLNENSYIKSADIIPLERLVDVVNRYDHFREVFLDEPDDDIHDFSLEAAISGLIIKFQNDAEVVRMAEIFLDALLINFKNKVNAEKIMKKALEFTSYWGKTLALETENDEILQLASKKGYDMAIRKSRQHGFIRIKLHPRTKKNLKKLHELVLKHDPEAMWYYHPSGKMLLNGSSKHKNFKVTKLSLNDIIELIKKIK